MPLFIDSHVHFYPSFRPDRFFAAFRAAAARLRAAIAALPVTPASALPRRGL